MCAHCRLVKTGGILESEEWLEPSLTWREKTKIAGEAMGEMGWLRLGG